MENLEQFPRYKNADVYSQSLKRCCAETLRLKKLTINFISLHVNYDASLKKQQLP